MFSDKFQNQELRSYSISRVRCERTVST